MKFFFPFQKLGILSVSLMFGFSRTIGSGQGKVALMKSSSKIKHESIVKITLESLNKTVDTKSITEWSNMKVDDIKMYEAVVFMIGSNSDIPIFNPPNWGDAIDGNVFICTKDEALKKFPPYQLIEKGILFSVGEGASKTGAYVIITADDGFPSTAVSWLNEGFRKKEEQGFEVEFDDSNRNDLIVAAHEVFDGITNNDLSKVPGSKVSFLSWPESLTVFAIYANLSSASNKSGTGTKKGYPTMLLRGSGITSISYPTFSPSQSPIKSSNNPSYSPTQKGTSTKPTVSSLSDDETDPFNPTTMKPTMEPTLDPSKTESPMIQPTLDPTSQTESPMIPSESSPPSKYDSGSFSPQPSMPTTLTMTPDPTKPSSKSSKIVNIKSSVSKSTKKPSKSKTKQKATKYQKSSSKRPKVVTDKQAKSSL